MRLILMKLAFIHYLTKRIQSVMKKKEILSFEIKLKVRQEIDGIM